MDTLSRKHRLRQQKQKQQQQVQRINHQVLFETNCEGKENQVQKQRQLKQQHLSASPEDYDMSFNSTVHNNSNNNNNNSSSSSCCCSEEEQFRVFKLVEIGQQQVITNGRGVSRRHVSERNVHSQLIEQINANKVNKSFPANPYCSISAAQQQQQEKRHHQQVSEVRNYRNVLPLNSTKNKHQYRNQDNDDNEVEDDDDDCDEVFQSNVYVPSLKRENRGKIQRQKQYYHRQKEKQQLQIEFQHQDDYQQDGGLLMNENGGEHSTSGSTTRSTAAYSSGFASEESGDRFHRSTATTTTNTGNNRCNSAVGNYEDENEDDLDVGFAERCANKLRQHSRQRSRVIADLDKLMINAGRCSISPAESCLSSCANSSTKVHINSTNEFDYSTLCRDEFSSFIPVQLNIKPDNVLVVSNNNEQQEKNPTKQTSGGPVLVGIHHESNDNYTELSIDSEESNSESGCAEQDAFELQEEIESSLSCTTSSSKNDTDPSIDKEIVIIGNSNDQHKTHDEQSSFRMMRTQNCERDDKLSEMLDIYLDRVESLLKLTRGEKSVSLEDAFGQDNEIKVSDEFKTEIEFSPIRQTPTTTKVIQEVEMIEVTTNEEDVINDENVCNIERNITNVNFNTMLLASPQTSAKLNWDQAFESIDLKNNYLNKEENEDFIDQQKRRLEASLLNRFLELDEFKLSSSYLSQKSGDILVNTIRRHVSEFIENYTIYQRELKARTSFASDWHQNWLFAFKRPNELSCSGRIGGTKRAKMSKSEETTLELDLVNERSSQTNLATTNRLDLIEYSTLILDKFKPVKLTYLMPPQINRNEIRNSTNESIEACYEAQEEELKELQCLSLESSRQTDVCRLLLCDFDDDAEGNYCKQEGKGLGKKRNVEIRKRRALLISYNTSLLIQKCSGNKFTFSSYGYLFQCNLPAVETSFLNGNITKRVREDILLLLKQKVELKEKRFKFDGDKCFNTSERVKFLVGVGKNVALINDLPVIQFCIKVSGSLPIKVRWFREENNLHDADNYEQQEISSLYLPHHSSRQSVRRRNIKVKEGLINGNSQQLNNWPIEMQANFDYEYQNEWSSWFRFKRCQDDILFEIRDANLEKDYGKRYKCVVENYCSLEECSFFLMKRSINESGKKVNSHINAKSKTPANNHALLRTWSQRTLHKPLPQTTMQPSEKSREEQQVGLLYNDTCFNRLTATSEIESNNVEKSDILKPTAVGRDENDLLNKRCSTFQTVGRLSATVAATEEDKFGCNFPYHPENLLKRLEQNKFSVPLKYKLLAQNLVAPIVDKIDAIVPRASIFGEDERMEISRENLSPTNSPRIQAMNAVNEEEGFVILNSETHGQILNEIQPLEKQHQQAHHLNDLSQRHLKSEELANTKSDGKLDEELGDESTNELANSLSQVNNQRDQESRNHQTVGMNVIDQNNCGHQIPPKPKLRQLANKQTLSNGSTQQLSRFTESTPYNLNQVDGQQHVIRRQLDTKTTTTTINTAGSQRPASDGQKLDLNGKLQGRQAEDSLEKEQLQQRPAIKVKPRVAAKSSKISSMSNSVADSDCIPKASVRSLISRFS